MHAKIFGIKYLYIYMLKNRVKNIFHPAEFTQSLPDRYINTWGIFATKNSMVYKEKSMEAMNNFKFIDHKM